jgi:hypothetical protein
VTKAEVTGTWEAQAEQGCSVGEQKAEESRERDPGSGHNLACRCPSHPPTRWINWVTLRALIRPFQASLSSAAHRSPRIAVAASHRSATKNEFDDQQFTTIHPPALEPRGSNPDQHQGLSGAPSRNFTRTIRSVTWMRDERWVELRLTLPQPEPEKKTVWKQCVPGVGFEPTCPEGQRGLGPPRLARFRHPGEANSTGRGLLGRCSSLCKCWSVHGSLGTRSEGSPGDCRPACRSRDPIQEVSGLPSSARARRVRTSSPLAPPGTDVP